MARFAPLQRLQHHAHSFPATRCNACRGLSSLETVWTASEEGAKGILVFAPILRKRVSGEEYQEETSAKLVVGFHAVYVIRSSRTRWSGSSSFCQDRGRSTGYTERLKTFVAQSDIQLEYSDLLSCPGAVLARQDHFASRAISRRGVCHSGALRRRTQSFTSRSAAPKRRSASAETEAEARRVCGLRSIGAPVPHRSADYIPTAIPAARKRWPITGARAATSAGDSCRDLSSRLAMRREARLAASRQCKHARLIEFARQDWERLVLW